MVAKIFHQNLKHLTSSFSSFSLVNADGQLLFSRDPQNRVLTTTRLVSFQIVKKYLQAKPGDIFVLNDPENGGFDFTQLIFVTSFSENLFLIWNEEFNFIDIKIPPIPLYESGKKNSHIWAALIEPHPQSSLLKEKIEIEKNKLNHSSYFAEQIKFLSANKNQNMWLRATLELFEQQFTNKALGSFECVYKPNPQQTIKLKLVIEEKQNMKSITFDFTQTSFAQNYSAASHVVESCLVQKFLQYYQMENFFTQSILDKIKIILPPKSIVSKANPRGTWNNEIQSICSHLVGHNLAQLNTQTRKPSSQFEILPELKFNILCDDQNYSLNFDSKSTSIDGLEQLLLEENINLSLCQKSEQKIHLIFNFTEKQKKKNSIQIISKLFKDCADYQFKMNNEPLTARTNDNLTSSDLFEIIWKIT